MDNPKIAYVIAGSEATGGAGIQADIKTFQQLGVYGLGTLTCIVSFDPKNNWSHRFFPIPANTIADQIEVACAAYDLDTVKIGMLGTPETISTVAQSLKRQPWKNLVVDPVLICKGQEPGAALNTDTALREEIIPLATVITPNLFEAQTLARLPQITSVSEMSEAARRIADLGPQYVVVKGGVELPGDDAVDVLWDGKNITEYRTPKIGTKRVAGAGCTLAAAITAELAKGNPVDQAIQTAKDLVTRGIAARIRGQAPFATVWQGA